MREEKAKGNKEALKETISQRKKERRERIEKGNNSPGNHAQLPISDIGLTQHGKKVAVMAGASSRLKRQCG